MTTLGIRCAKSLQIKKENFEVSNNEETKPSEVPTVTKAKPAAAAAPAKNVNKQLTQEKTKKKSSGKSNAIASMFAKAPPKKDNTETDKKDSPGKENKV